MDQNQPYSYWPTHDIEKNENAFCRNCNTLLPNEAIDLMFCHKSGRLIPVRVNISQVMLESNRIFWSAIVLDLTEIKQYEKQLIKLNADKDRFITILAHDLKSPFNGILGLSDLLVKNIRKYDTDKIENVANVIHQAALQTYTLLDELLLWTRAQSGKLPFKPEKLNFENICSDIIDNLKLEANNKDITISNSQKEEVNLLADINMFKTILRNLISNAIKFTNNGGKIDICTSKNHANVTISVTDNGIGIPPDTLTKLFDISHIISTEGTANEKGTGLGLLLCKEFVEKHSGKIWVESKYGKSSEFKFTMPLFIEKINNFSNLD